MINRAKVKPGNWDDYLKFEGDIAKPLFEEAIKREQRSSWSVCQSWPYKKGQARLITVNGYKSVEQMTFL